MFTSSPQSNQPIDWVALIGDVGVSCLNSRKFDNLSEKINLLREVIECRRAVWYDSNLAGKPFYTNQALVRRT
jgi:hypothetical protein